MVRVQPEVRVEAQGVSGSITHDERRVAACIPIRLQYLIKRIQRDLEIALCGRGVGFGPKVFADLIAIERRLTIREKQLEQLTGFLAPPAVRRNDFASALDLKGAQRFNVESKPGMALHTRQAKRLEQTNCIRCFPIVVAREDEQGRKDAFIGHAQMRNAGKEKAVIIFAAGREDLCQQAFETVGLFLLVPPKTQPKPGGSFTEWITAFLKTKQGAVEPFFGGFITRCKHETRTHRQARK